MIRNIHRGTFDANGGEAVDPGRERGYGCGKYAGDKETTQTGPQSRRDQSRHQLVRRLEFPGGKGIAVDVALEDDEAEKGSDPDDEDEQGTVEVQSDLSLAPSRQG